MSISVAAIGAAAVARDEPILWVANSANADPTYILPLIFAVLICLYLDSVFVRSAWQRVLVWIGGLLILTATGSLLDAAADIYLIASAAFLLLQRAIVTNQVARLIQRLARWRLGDDVVSLDDVERLLGCGNKAYRLGVARAHGFPVPEGIVLNARFLERFTAAPRQGRIRILDHIWQRLGAKTVAVRSSGSAEDNSTNSFAGVFASVLHVDRSRLEEAVAEVLRSFSSAVVDGYGIENAQPNILVQRMIDPDYSGVLFTRDPARPGHSLVELVEGTAEKLVSGAVAPISCRIGRVSRQPLADDTAPIDLKPLIDIGHRLETLFKHPQDIEWAYSGGRFYIVQSRDITASAQAEEQDQRTQSEWSRVLGCATSTTPDDVAFEQNELSEVLPRPTRLSLSLMESMWSSGGSIDLACRKIGINYRVDEDSPPYLVTVFGNLYVNKTEELARAPKLSTLATWRLNKLARNVESDFTENFLPSFLKEISLLEAVDFEKLSTVDLLDAVERIRRNYALSTGVSTSVINIVADYRLKSAKTKLIEAGLPPAKYLVRLNQTEFERSIADARTCPADSREAFLLRGLGHRSPVDYELAEPRYAEKTDELLPLLQGPIPSTKFTADLSAELKALSTDSRLIDAVLAACSFQTLKENAKHHSLRELAVLRRAVEAVDRRFDLDGLIFQLTFEEIAALANGDSLLQLRAVANERRDRGAQTGQIGSVSPTLTVKQLETYASGLRPETSERADRAAGVRVSGSGIVEGRARVIKADEVAAMSIIPDFKDGEIVVSRMIPIAWIPYFQRAGGFVCEVGGWLSHTAIVAREFNVPLIIQAKGLQLIETGSLIRLHPDGAIEVLPPELAVAAE